MPGHFGQPQDWSQAREELLQNPGVKAAYDQISKDEELKINIHKLLKEELLLIDPKTSYRDFTLKLFSLIKAYGYSERLDELSGIGFDEDTQMIVTNSGTKANMTLQNRDTELTALKANQLSQQKEGK